MSLNPEFWNQLAERYAKKPVDDPDAFERMIEIAKARMKPGQVVLEVGCGTGSLALRLAETGAHIHGLDFSEAMIRIAEGKREAQGADNVQFQVGPFDQGFDTFGPGEVDGVLAFSILHLVEDRRATLEHIFKLLKPGGFFISSTVCLGESLIPYRPLLSVMRWMGKAPWVGIVSRSEIQEEIAQAGFVEVEQPDVGAKSQVGFVTAVKP